MESPAKLVLEQLSRKVITQSLVSRWIALRTFTGATGLLLTRVLGEWRKCNIMSSVRSNKLFSLDQSNGIALRFAGRT
jgi:hypothetical protein